VEGIDGFQEVTHKYSLCKIAEFTSVTGGAFGGKFYVEEINMSDANKPARKRRSERGKRAVIPTPAYIKRVIPFFDPLDEGQLQRIEGMADWLIQEKGIAFKDDPVALDIWRKAGADVSGDCIVRLPKGMARELCKTIPSEFEQVARNPAKSVRMGGSSQVFAAIYGAPFVRDLDEGRRYGTIADHEKLVKLTSMLPSIHHGGLVIVEPCDVPVSTRHLDMVYNHMVYSDKPHLGAITEMSRAQDSVDMARILHGADTFDKNCVIMGNVNTNSPLLVDRVVTEAIRTYNGNGQGIVVVPFILSGAMGPVSTAASIAQALAEAMIVGAFSQLVRKGSPFIMGNFLSSMSLKSGAPTFGMPEPVMSNYAIGQLARRLGVPLRCGGSLTASKVADAQAMAESVDSMHSTMLAGAHFVLHAAGWLEGGLCTGYEKLLLDADRLGSYQKILGQGLDVSDEALAKDAYGEVEPGGHFLGSSHTMRNYENAFYEAPLSDSESCEQWEEKGSKDAEVRANERVKTMLNEYQEPPIDAGVKEELQAFVAKRKEELPVAWY
jgi:trimethylamine--corrinoid protein Co-methyltransferase